MRGTRGKNENHIYFSTAEADPHRILAPKATHPPTAVDILSAILRRDGAQVSAHSAAAAESDPFTRLHAAAAMYSDALTAAAEHTAGAATMAHIDAAAVAIRANITDYGAWPVLRRNLALLAVDGHDPIEALHAAAATPLGKPHRRRRGARLAAADTARVGRRAGRSAALAGGHPRRAGRTPPMGPLPARALPARRRSGRPDPRRRAPMAARYRPGLGAPLAG